MDVGVAWKDAWRDSTADGVVDGAVDGVVMANGVRDGNIMAAGGVVGETASAGKGGALGKSGDVDAWRPAVKSSLLGVRGERSMEG